MALTATSNRAATAMTIHLRLCPGLFASAAAGSISAAVDSTGIDDSADAAVALSDVGVVSSVGAKFSQVTLLHG